MASIVAVAIYKCNHLLEIYWNPNRNLTTNY